jgi:hypothetical protein
MSPRLTHKLESAPVSTANLSKVEIDDLATVLRL